VYIRFIIPTIHEDSRKPTGVFQAAYALRDSGELGAEELQDLRAQLDWFNKNLHIPRNGIHARAIFWFSSASLVCTRRVWRLVQTLRKHHRHVEMVKSAAPGRIVYRDGHQVAAMPVRPRHKKKR
jgi:hypothetical protein